MSFRSRLMTYILANYSCLNFPIVLLPMPVLNCFFPIPKCKKLPPASGHLPTAINVIIINAISAANAIIMPRGNNNNDNRQRDEDKNKRRRRQEEEKKKVQRRKKARRPDLADTPADLAIDNLFGDAGDPPQDAGNPAPVEDPDLGNFFAPTDADDDALLESSAAEEEEEEGEAAPFIDEEEGMDVDSIEDAPSNSAAPPPPQEKPRSGPSLCHQEAPPTEVELGPIGDWAASRLSDGSHPETVRDVGCQANVGLERLARRLTWLKASRRRYRLNRLKRRRESSLLPPAPVPEAAPTASDPPAPQ